MSDKGRALLANAADKINDVVEDLTFDAAVERNAKCVAAEANEQVDLPEIPESASLPSQIDPTSSGRAARERLETHGANRRSACGAEVR